MSEELKTILDKLEIVARKHTIEVCEDGLKIETMPANIVDELRLNNYSANLLLNYIQQKENIIKEVREYITSYESIETIQQCDHSKNNKDLDYSTINEMTRRYLIVHDKVLEILDKGE